MSPDDHQDDDHSLSKPDGSDLAEIEGLADAYFRTVAGRRDDER